MSSFSCFSLKNSNAEITDTQIAAIIETIESISLLPTAISIGAGVGVG